MWWKSSKNIENISEKARVYIKKCNIKKHYQCVYLHHKRKSPALLIKFQTISPEGMNKPIYISLAHFSWFCFLKSLNNFQGTFTPRFLSYDILTIIKIYTEERLLIPIIILLWNPLNKTISREREMVWMSQCSLGFTFPFLVVRGDVQLACAPSAVITQGKTNGCQESSPPTERLPDSEAELKPYRVSFLERGIKICIRVLGS